MEPFHGSDLLKLIVDTSRQMSMIRELTPLLEYVIEEVLALVGAERGYVVLLTPDNKLDFRVGLNRDGNNILGQKKAGEDGISRSILDEVTKTGEALVLTNALTDPRFAQAHSVVYMRLRSVMCVPLTVHETILGAIYVENRSVKGRFHDEDLMPLALFANQAAVAIANAKLNEELIHTNQILRSEIEERIQIQSQLQKYTHELEKMNRELGELTSVAAHQLQEPLRKLQLFSDRLWELYQSTTDAKGLDYLQRLRVASAQMQSQMEDFRIFTVLTKQPLEIKIVSLNRVLDDVLALLNAKIVASQANIQADTLPYIEADKERMVQLLKQLLDNALKFQQPDVPPKIQITCGIPDKNDRIPITITDNGIGFDEKHKKRIFRAFQRLHEDENDIGTGIGLAICRKIVEQHGGEISAQSTLGTGTTISIWLPVSASQ